MTVGKPEVIINGESRPLDVPPIMYQGNVLVPVRVISEGMGAYVLWVGNRQRVVVVRYIPPTPPPPPSTPAPPPPPTPTPTPMATPYHDLYVAGDYIISPKVYNEFSPGTTACNTCNGFSYRLHGAVEFDLLNLPWMVEGDYRQFNYQHPNGFVTVIGDNGAAFVPAFNARDYDLDARVGLRVLQPRIYIGVGYIWRGNNAGYPSVNGVGFGLEKLPDMNRPFSFYGSAYYYPSVKGTIGPFTLRLRHPEVRSGRQLRVPGHSALRRRRFPGRARLGYGLFTLGIFRSRTLRRHWREVLTSLHPTQE